MSPTRTNETILVLCRAVPEESRKYLQTVCAAGITDSGGFRRLYPVIFKPFETGGGIPFRKKDWIEATTLPPDDKRDTRIESRKIDEPSVKVVRHADDNEIRKIIQSRLCQSVKEIQDAGASLGFIKPRIVGFDCVVESTDEWNKSQVDLDGKPVGKIRLGQESRYSFFCQKRKACCDHRPHKMEIRDWEANELYRNIIRKEKNHALIRQKMRNKFYDWMTTERDVYFMMGNHHRWKVWMIVSVLYLRRPNSTAQTAQETDA